MTQMKKFVLKLDLHDNKDKQKAMKRVSTFSGIDSISIDMNARKLMVTGTVDPVRVAIKLRKYWPTDIISVGPAKEPEKKEEPKKEEAKKEEQPKKEEAKKEEPKKEEAKKEEPKKEEAKEEPKKEEAKKEEPKKEEAKKEELPPPPDPVLELVKAAYNPHHTTYYYVHSMEENPNACVIC